MSKFPKMNISKKQFSVRAIASENGRDALFGLFMDGVLLKTPSGFPVTSDNQKLLRVMGMELDFSDVLDVQAFNLYSLYCTQIEFVTSGKDIVGFDFTKCLEFDPILQTCSGPEAVFQLRYYETIMDYFERNGLCYPNYPRKSGSSTSSGDVSNLTLAGFIGDEIISLSPSQISGFLTGIQLTKSIILSLLLVKGEIVPIEFAALYMITTCTYSKIFPDIERKKERKLLDFIIRGAESIRTYVELTK